METTEVKAGFEGDEKNNIGWRNHIFKLPSVMALVAILGMLVHSPLMSFVSLLCFIGIVSVFIFAVVYSIYHRKREGISAGYLVFCLLSFFFMWALSSAYFLESMAGGLEWSHLGVMWERGLTLSVLMNGLTSSGFLIVIFYMCFMLAFKSKRKAKSILNVVTYWSLFIAFYISVEPIKQFMYPAM